MQKINRYIRKIPFLSAFFVLAAVVVCFTFLYLIYFEFLGERFDIVFVENPYDGIENFVFMVLVLAPLLETLIFQVGVFHLLRLIKWLRKRECYIVFISGVLFGLDHFFSLSHIIVTTLLGFFFMYVYLVRRRKGGYWMVVLLHAFYNGLLLLYSNFSQSCCCNC